MYHLPKHQNIKFKLLALNSYVARMKHPELKIDTEEHLVDILLCSKSDNQRFHKLPCLSRECIKCKDHKKSLQKFYGPVLSNSDTIKWNRWQNDKETKKKPVVSKCDTIGAAVEEMGQDVETPLINTSFPLHQFTASWQSRNYKKLKEDLPINGVLMIFDFGKNREIRHQDEAKSSFYSAQQVTVHPVVMYYRSQNVPDLTVRDSMIFLTDDINHDHHAVQYFLKESLKYLRKVNPHIEHLYFLTGVQRSIKAAKAFLHSLWSHHQSSGISSAPTMGREKQTERLECSTSHLTTLF